MVRRKQTSRPSPTPQQWFSDVLLFTTGHRETLLPPVTVSLHFDSCWPGPEGRGGLRGYLLSIQPATSHTSWFFKIFLFFQSYGAKDHMVNGQRPGRVYSVDGHICCTHLPPLVVTSVWVCTPFKIRNRCN